MRKKPPSPATSGGDAPLSPLIHGRVRLLAMSHLVRSGATVFTVLRDALGVTDGTLSVHLSRLEAGGAVEILKEFEGRKPRTVVRPTARGRAMFRRYVEELRAIVPGLGPDDA